MIREVASTMKNGLLGAALLGFAFSALPARSQDNSAVLGIQRAASSPLKWEIRDAGHPALGEIRFAFLKTPIETQIGNAKIYSRAYFSCQKGTKKLAIELASATSPDDPKGLKPAVNPKLLCSRPMTSFDDKLVQEELLANWEVSEIGDALSRNFRAFPLRECVSIRVEQEVVLPPNWIQKTAKISFEIPPYARELDAVFMNCGEQSAYGLGAPAVAVAPNGPAPSAPASPPVRMPPPSNPVVAAAPTPAPAHAPPPPLWPKAAEPVRPAAPVATAPAPAAPVDASWQNARTPSDGKTNVRATPSTGGAVVTQLDPGATVLVQKTANEWWKAKAAGGKPFEGYIRQDRLVFR